MKKRKKKRVVSSCLIVNKILKLKVPYTIECLYFQKKSYPTKLSIVALSNK